MTLISFASFIVLLMTAVLTSGYKVEISILLIINEKVFMPKIIVNAKPM